MSICKLWRVCTRKCNIDCKDFKEESYAGEADDVWYDAFIEDEENTPSPSTNLKTEVSEDYFDLLELQHKFQLRAEDYFNSKIKDKNGMVFHHADFLKNAVKMHWKTDHYYDGHRVVDLVEFLNFK